MRRWVRTRGLAARLPALLAVLLATLAGGDLSLPAALAVGPDGIVSTLAGSGLPGHVDGPRGVALGPAGELYVADQLNGRIRRVRFMRQ